MTATARIGSGVVAALGVLLLIFVATAHQAVADAPPTLQGENIVHYDWSDSLPLESGVQTIVQGEAIDGGCTFTHEVTLGPDDPGLTIRELSYDPDSCRAVFLTGVKGGTTFTGEETITYSEEGGGGVIATKARQWTGTWRDPVNIPVNWNRSRLKWKYDTGLDEVIEVIHTECLYYRLEHTQWFLSYDSGCFDAYVNNHSQYWVWSSKEFDNNWFWCNSDEGRGATTRVYNHTIKGYGNGYYTGTTQMSKWGPCSNLLHAETDFAHYNQ